jgi:hypothetical protein
MKNSKALIPEGQIEQGILIIRGQRVIMDSDLARLYGLTTKALNQAVKRNVERFPDEFAFRLSPEEAAYLLRIRKMSVIKKENRSHSVTGSQKHRDPRYLPYAFTEHVTLMAANILRSQRTVPRKEASLCNSLSHTIISTYSIWRKASPSTGRRCN